MKPGLIRFMREEHEDYLMETDPNMWVKRRSRNATTNHDRHQNGRPVKDLQESSVDLSEDTCSDEFPSRDSTLRQIHSIRGAMKGKRLYRRSSTASTVPMSSSFVCDDDYNENNNQQQQQAGCVPESEGSIVHQEVESTVSMNHGASLQHDAHREAKDADLLPVVLDAIHNRHWNQVLSLLEQDPSLAKRSVIMVIQGENSSALLVHLLCGIKETPVSVVDALVTLHPTSLLQKDERAGRLPIHIAVVRDAFPELVQYLCKASPKALRVQDQEGNLPLHYAAMHGSAVVLQALLAAYPQGCQTPNSRDRFPIHLVCARCYDATPLPTKDLEALIQSYPEALVQLDRFGRTPLHLAASVQHPQWQVLQVLMEHTPQAILYRDKSQKTPLQCAKSGHNRSNDVVVSYLTEATNRERRLRRQASSWIPLSLGRHRKKEKETKNDLYCCYG